MITKTFGYQICDGSKDSKDSKSSKNSKDSTNSVHSFDIYHISLRHSDGNATFASLTAHPST